MKNRSSVDRTRHLPPIDIHPGTRFLASLLGAPGLDILFEPIVSFRPRMSVHCLAAVVNGPAATSIEHPRSLQRMARDLGLEVGVDRLTATTAIRRVGESGAKTRLKFDVGLQTLVDDRGFDGLLERACERYGVALDSLILAISFRRQFKPSQHVQVLLDRLRRRGVTIALESRGGNPMDEVMIQALRPQFVVVKRAWVTGVKDDPIRSLALETMVSDARLLGAAVIAKGVTTPSDLDFVRAAGVELAQGLLLGSASLKWLSSPWRDQRSETGDGSIQDESTH